MRHCVASLVALLVGSHASAEDLGRLFTTGEERASLDRPPAVSQPRETRFQGVVVGPDGKAVAWFNDRPLHPGEREAEITVVDVQPNGAAILRTAPEESDPAGEAP